MPTSTEFIWGIAIGALLTAFGSWLFAIFSSWMRKKEQKDLVVSFCADTIRNVQGIIIDLDATRDRSKLIHDDFLTLIDVEIGTFGRNREHLIHLPEPVRGKVRKFVNDCAIKKAEVASKLSQFNDLWVQANQFEAEGKAPEGYRKREQPQVPLNEAHKAADKLLHISSTGSDIINELSKVK